MSDEDRPGLLKRGYGTVSPGYSSHSDAEMDSLGRTILLLVAVVFAPLLPFLVVVSAVTEALDALGNRGGGESDGE